MRRRPRHLTNRRWRSAVVALLILASAACAHGPEQALLSQFFAASRLRDLTALQKISTVVFEPLRDGIVTDFDIDSVTATGADTEDVMITAPVRLPDGRTVSKRFVVNVQRGVIAAISEREAASTPPR